MEETLTKLIGLAILSDGLGEFECELLFHEVESSEESSDWEVDDETCEHNK